MLFSFLNYLWVSPGEKPTATGWLASPPKWWRRVARIRVPQGQQALAAVRMDCLGYVLPARDPAGPFCCLVPTRHEANISPVLACVPAREGGAYLRLPLFAYIRIRVYTLSTCCVGSTSTAMPPWVAWGGDAPSSAVQLNCPEWGSSPGRLLPSWRLPAVPAGARFAGTVCTNIPGLSRGLTQVGP